MSKPLEIKFYFKAKTQTLGILFLIKYLNWCVTSEMLVNTQSKWSIYPKDFNVKCCGRCFLWFTWGIFSHKFPKNHTTRLMTKTCLYLLVISTYTFPTFSCVLPLLEILTWLLEMSQGGFIRMPLLPHLPLWVLSLSG